MLNLGGLFFTLGADTRGLDNARRQIQQFAGDVDRAFRAVSAGAQTPQFANQMLKQERSLIQMLERVKALQGQIANSSIGGKRSGQNLISDLSAAYTDFARVAGKGVPLNTAEFSRRIAHMQSQIRDTQREFTQLQTIANSSAKGITNFTGVLQGLGGASLIVQGHLGGMSTRFLALSGLVREFGVTAAITSASVAGFAAGIALLGSNAITAGRQMMSLQGAMTAVVGNTAVAGANLNIVKDIANQAGVAFESTARSFTRFMASGKAAGLNLTTIEQSFRGVAVAAATLQISAQDTEGVFRALDQILSKGTVQSEELRGQLGDRFPAAFAIAAKAVGKTTAQLNDMLKKGQVISAEFVPQFVKAMMDFYHIDISKPVDNLTASLGRLSNEWMFFGVALDNATGASRLYKQLIDGLIGSLQWMQTNIRDIIGVVGGLTGAFIGLGVAIGATALIQWVGTLGPLINWIGIVIRSVSAWSAAQVILNATVSAFPVTRVITLIVSLAATIGGAVAGYNILTSAVDRNNASLNNTAGIESYIEAQKRLGYQVRSTTMAFMEQIAVQNKIDSAAASEAGLAAAAGSQPDLFDKALAFTASALTGGQMTPGQALGARATKLEKEATSAVEKARRTADLYNELLDLMKLPDEPIVPVPPGGDGGGRRGANAIDQVEDFILKMTQAEDRLKVLATGTREYKLVDDLFRAREALNQLNDVQLGKVDAALKAAGYGAGELDSRLAAVMTRTRQASEAAQAYVRIWDDLQAASSELVGLNQQLDFLRSGGDPTEMFRFDSIAKATEALRDINPATTAGQQALTGLQTRLRELGVIVETDGNIFDNTRNALAAYIDEGEKARQLVSIFANLHSELVKINDDINKTNMLSNAFSSGGFMDIFNADVGEAADRAIARGQKVLDFARALKAAGASQGEITLQSQRYLDSLRNLDAATEVYDRMKSSAEATRDAFRDLAHTGTSFIRDLISGTKSLSDALMDLANNVLDTMWERFINMPIDNWFDQLGRAKGEQRTAGLDATVAGLGSTTDANAGAVSALGAAAGVAAQAMSGNFLSGLTQSATGLVQQVTAQGAELAATTTKAAAQTQETASIISCTLALNMMTAAAATATAALGAMATASTLSSASGSGAGLSSLFSGAGGAALGGNMNAGQVYQINEPGLTGEYFIPAVNGYMSNDSPLKGAVGNKTVIDARTTIDARGASTDAVAQLTAAMRARDAKLRAELPLLIDARVRDSQSRRRI